MPPVGTGSPRSSVTPHMVLDTLERDGAALPRRLEDAGVRVQVIDAIGGDLPGSLAGSAGADLCFQAAEAVGAPIVNICHYRFEGEPPGLSEMTDAVGTITRDAASRGLRVVLEFVPDSGIPDLAFAMAIVQGVDLPACGVLLDPWHLARSGGTVADVAALPVGSIGAFQLDDRIEPPPGTPYVPMTGRDLPGEGDLPLHELARRAVEQPGDHRRGRGVQRRAAVALVRRRGKAGARRGRRVARRVRPTVKLPELSG